MTDPYPRHVLEKKIHRIKRLPKSEKEKIVRAPERIDRLFPAS